MSKPSSSVFPSVLCGSFLIREHKLRLLVISR
jgi:hypothetical protein